MEEEIVDEHLDKVRTYVSQKVADLKKKAKTDSKNAFDAELVGSEDVEEANGRTLLTAKVTSEENHIENISDAGSETQRSHNSSHESDLITENGLEAGNGEEIPEILPPEDLSNSSKDSILNNKENRPSKTLDDLFIEEESAFIEVTTPEPLKFNFIDVPIVNVGNISPEILTNISTD